jgi:hypothetical protein
MCDPYGRWIERVRQRAALEASEQEEALARVVASLGARLARLTFAEQVAGRRDAARQRVEALRHWRDELAGVLAGVSRGRAQRRRREADALLERCRRLAGALQQAADRELADGASAELGLQPPLSRRSLDEVRELADAGIPEAWRSRTASLLLDAARSAPAVSTPAPIAPSPRTAELEERLARLGVTGEVLRSLAELSGSQLEEYLEAFLRRRAHDANAERAWELPVDPLAEVQR